MLKSHTCEYSAALQIASLSIKLTG